MRRCGWSWGVGAGWAGPPESPGPPAWPRARSRGRSHPADPAKACCPRAIAACHPRAETGEDNAVMESFDATDQRECVGLAEARGGDARSAEARQDFFDDVEKYDHRVRRPSALGYKTPVDFENQLN